MINSNSIGSILIPNLESSQSANVHQTCQESTFPFWSLKSENLRQSRLPSSHPSLAGKIILSPTDDASEPPGKSHTVVFLIAEKDLRVICVFSQLKRCHRDVSLNLPSIFLPWRNVTWRTPKICCWSLFKNDLLVYHYNLWILQLRPLSKFLRIPVQGRITTPFDNHSSWFVSPAHLSFGPAIEKHCLGHFDDLPLISVDQPPKPPKRPFSLNLLLEAFTSGRYLVVMLKLSSPFTKIFLYQTFDEGQKSHSGDLVAPSPGTKSTVKQTWYLDILTWYEFENIYS